MVEPKILVTGATGKTGAAVVAQLLARGMRVRAVVRTNDARSERLQALGAETVVADLYDPSQVLDAMRGTNRAYYCPPIQAFMIQGAVAFAVAAHQAKLEQVVMLSQWLSSPSHPALMTRQTWLADNLFAMLPETSFTIVNPGFFADNYLRLIGFAAHLGIFPNLFGDSRNAPPSNEDMARVVVEVLANPAKHHGRRYRPTGPELLSVSEMAVILGRVLNRKVRTMPMPFWMFTKAARMQGVPEFEVDVFRAYVADHKQGAFALGAPSSDILAVTGKPAESFETTTRRYAAAPEAQRSVGNTMKAFAEFMRTPVAPGYNVDRYERMMGLPVPPMPRSSMEDAQWVADHMGQNAPSENVQPIRTAAIA